MLFGLIVLINGILCHGGALLGKSLWKIDLISNIIMIIFTNIKTSWQPHTIYLSGIAMIIYTLKVSLCQNIMEPFIHILLVQLPLAICLNNYS